MSEGTFSVLFTDSCPKPRTVPGTHGDQHRGVGEFVNEWTDEQQQQKPNNNWEISKQNQ